jgi:pimeloyl-ACP methyl ester carboxylesterase
VRKLPSDLDAQWARVRGLAAADPAVGRSAAELDALLRRVLARLEKEPVSVPVRDAATRAPGTVPVGAFGLRLLLAFDLGDTRDFPKFPRLLADLDRGETATLAPFVEKRLAQFREFNALTWVCRAASEASAERWKRIEAEAKQSPFGNAANVPFPEARASVALPDLGPEFRQPVASTVRALFVSGSLDSNTPAHQAEAVRRAFPSGTALVIENAGHEDSLDMPEVHALVARFFAGEDVSGARLARPAPRFEPLSRD